jgi:hypothetical protein
MNSLLLFVLGFLIAPVAFAGELHLRSDKEGEIASDTDFDYQAMPEFHWAMDPFLKVPGQTRLPDLSPEQYKLEAVTVKGENPVAVVNGQVVHVGDKVNGRLVVRIEKDFVLLEAGGSIVEASLYDEDRAPASTESPSGNVEKAVDGEKSSKAGSGNATGNQAGDGTVRIEEVRK